PQLLKWSSAFSLYLRYLMFKLPHFSKRTTSVARYALDSHKTPVNIGLARLHALNPFTLPAGGGKSSSFSSSPSSSIFKWASVTCAPLLPLTHHASRLTPRSL